MASGSIEARLSLVSSPCGSFSETLVGATGAWKIHHVATRPMRLLHVALVAVAAVSSPALAGRLAAQEPRKLTADDYARAEKQLGATTAALVSGQVGRRLRETPSRCACR